MKKYMKEMILASGMVTLAGLYYLVIKYDMDLKEIKERLEMEGRCVDTIFNKLDEMEF